MSSFTPDPEIVRRTFSAELIRSFATGVMETALSTFAILIAIRVYDSSPTTKALIVGSHAAGLIGSLLVVPLAYRTGWKTTRLAAGFHFLGATGFLFAAVARGSEAGFIGGICFGFIFMALPVPLQTQFWRQNFPDQRRGRMFSFTMMVRALATISFSLIGGWLLGQNFDWFPWLLATFAGAAVVSGFCLWNIPAPALPPESIRPHVFRAMRWLKRDRVFRLTILSGMIMGIGVLSAHAVSVDYLANPRHGLAYSPEKVGLVAGAIPATLRLLTTIFWGGLFDRINFFRYRLAVNLIFAAAITLFFSTGWFWMIVIGAALLGCARGGGEIIWNLWVTKMSSPEHAAEYMSVHTFLTGIRAAAAPFIGFYLISFGSIHHLLFLSLGFVLVSTIILLPLIRNPPGSK